MIHTWKKQGYSHFHFGAIRLALLQYGCKDLLMVAKMAFFDSQYREYQHAYISTLKMILNGVIVFLLVSKF